MSHHDSEIWTGPRFGLKMPKGSEFSTSGLAWMTSAPYAWQFGLKPKRSRTPGLNEPTATVSWETALGLGDAQPAVFASALADSRHEHEVRAHTAGSLGMSRAPQRLRPIESVPSRGSDSGTLQHRLQHQQRGQNPLKNATESTHSCFPPSAVMTSTQRRRIDGGRGLATPTRLPWSTPPRPSRVQNMGGAKPE